MFSFSKWLIFVLLWRLGFQFVFGLFRGCMRDAHQNPACIIRHKGEPWEWCSVDVPTPHSFLVVVVTVAVVVVFIVVLVVCGVVFAVVVFMLLSSVAPVAFGPAHRYYAAVTSRQPATAPMVSQP